MAKQIKNNGGYTRAKLAAGDILAVGIIETVSVIFGLILFIVKQNAEAGDAKVIENIFAWLYFPMAVAILVLLILIWTRHADIKKNTKVSPLWTSVGYPVAYGLQIISSVALVLCKSDAAVLALFIVAEVIEVFILVVSYVTFARIRTTLHK